MTQPNFAKPSVGMNKVCGQMVATPLFWHCQQSPTAIGRRLTFIAPYPWGGWLGVGLGACLIGTDVMMITEQIKITERLDSSVVRVLLRDMTDQC